MYDPYSIRVFLGDREMSRDRHYIAPQSDTITTSDYNVGLKFVLERDDLEFKGLNSTPIRIIMDGFLSCDGVPVHIDTVRAFERKSCPTK